MNDKQLQTILKISKSRYDWPVNYGPWVYFDCYKLHGKDQVSASITGDGRLFKHINENSFYNSSKTELIVPSLFSEKYCGNYLEDINGLVNLLNHLEIVPRVVLYISSKLTKEYYAFSRPTKDIISNFEFNFHDKDVEQLLTMINDPALLRLSI